MFIASIASRYTEKPDGVRNLFLQPIVKSLNWLELTKLGLPHSVGEIKRLCHRTIHFFYWLDWPDCIQKLFQRVTECKDAAYEGDFGKTAMKTKDVFVNASLAMGTVATLFKILHDDGFLSLSHRSLSILSAIDLCWSISIFITSIEGGISHAKTAIAESLGSVKSNYALLNVAKKVMLTAVGVFGMISPFFSVPAVLYLAVTTTFIALTVASYFYKELHRFEVEI